jgi:enediyne biosynthesis protein E4
MTHLARVFRECGWVRLLAACCFVNAFRSLRVSGAFVGLALGFSIIAAVAVLEHIPAQAAEPLFVEAAAASGLNFVHENGATGKYYMPEVMGSGAALFDYDNDGDLDVYLVQWGRLSDIDRDANAAAPAASEVASSSGRSSKSERKSTSSASPPQDASSSSRLFRNDLSAGADGKRTLRFTDVTKQAGVGRERYGMGTAVADYDNDGDLDLFVTAFGPDTLYRNNGDGTFTDVTSAAGLKKAGTGWIWSSSAAFLDYDRDGDLDLFVANYLDFTPATNKLCYDSVGARDYCTPRAYRPVPDRLFRNEGNGAFTDVSDAAGITKADGAGLGVSTGDYDGDGWIDLYVANDATPNQLWINQKNGTFADMGPLSGAAVNASGNPEGSMGIASGDYDADGDEDLFVTNIVGETYALYVNNGRGDFDDQRVRAVVAQPTAAFTGFGTDWFDYDNDGWLDLFVANGAVNVIPSQRGEKVPFRMINQLFRNLGSPAGGDSGGGSLVRFADMTSQAGPAFARPEVNRGAAFGDIDNDGDVDVLVTTNAGPVRLLLNQASQAAEAGARNGLPVNSPSSSRNHWLQIRLEQAGRNRFAFGARVGVERAGKPTVWRRVRSDGSYLSASDHRIHIGLGASAAIDAVVVEWPDANPASAVSSTPAISSASRERWTNVQIDRPITLRRGGGAAQR